MADVTIATAPLDTKCSIIVKNHPAVLPRRSMFRKLPYGSVENFAPIHVDSNDVATQVAGLTHRVCRVTPYTDKIDRALLHEFSLFVVRWCNTYLTPIGEVPDFEDWLSKTSYTEERKKELRERSLELAGAAPNRKQRRKIASFIKTESYPDFKHARWINSRSDHFKVYSGPWFKKIEDQVFSLRWFIKHVSVPDRAQHVVDLMRDGARYFATDYTSFESHFHPAFMKACEFNVYRYMLQKYPDVAEVICSTLSGCNHGRTRRGVSFRLRGRRMSGDMCTSLGNGLANLLIWSFWCEKRGVEWEGRVEGDDGIFAVYKGQPPTPPDYAALGFTIKMEEGPDPRIMSFCGIIAAGGQNIRRLDEFLSSFGWTSSFITAGPKIMHELLRAKAMSAAYEMPHCPVIRAIADRALFLTREYVPRFVRDGYHALPELRVPEFSPNYDTRLAFEALTGVSVASQFILEDKIRGGQPLDILSAYVSPTPANIRFASFHVFDRIQS